MLASPFFFFARRSMKTKRVLRKLGKFVLDAVEIHGSALFLCTLCFTMFLQVVFRYLLKHPSPDLFEVTQYSFPWGVLLGAACAQRYRDHMRFNILYERFPNKLRLLLDVFFDLAMVGFFAYSLPPILRQTLWYHMLRSEVLGIPWTYLVFCLPIFMVLVILHNVVHVWRALQEIIGGRPRQVEAKPWL